MDGMVAEAFVEPSHQRALMAVTGFSSAAARSVANSDTVTSSSSSWSSRVVAAVGLPLAHAALAVSHIGTMIANEDRR
jgi:hypothetical protein